MLERTFRSRAWANLGSDPSWDDYRLPRRGGRGGRPPSSEEQQQLRRERILERQEEISAAERKFELWLHETENGVPLAEPALPASYLQRAAERRNETLINIGQAMEEALDRGCCCARPWKHLRSSLTLAEQQPLRCEVFGEFKCDECGTSGARCTPR